MRLLRLKEVDSTNSYVERNAASMHHGDVVTAHTQTVGRGQRGNTWESEPGANITFTMLLRPHIAASQQFVLSSMIALQICDTLEEFCNVKCKVKWPNDIYAGEDKKICGILISHALQGRSISHTIAGAGININQKHFFSDAPNPVSVWQLTGHHHDCDVILDSLARKIESGSDLISDEDYRKAIAHRYRQMLWRGDNQDYPFLDTSTGEHFHASIDSIEPTGHLLLRDTQGNLRRFAFKEVAWL